jgi:hypothetical protein
MINGLGITWPGSRSHSAKWAGTSCSLRVAIRDAQGLGLATRVLQDVGDNCLIINTLGDHIGA